MRQLIFLVAIVGSLAMPTPRAAAVVGEAIWTQVAKLPVGSGPGQVTYESHPTGGVGRGPQARLQPLVLSRSPQPARAGAPAR